ncbi:hypothetical protein VitviT2T_013616 [Vitis vinifera]|uniref:Inhibitor I9 domain-containing protein n=1 Tax=Vitis vinifera TaxID=29760 RepID=A0ABY9CI83_VITVI|nr:hypothetical protein VitviT2T_013616 [Vitis vinifera]
MMSSFHYWKMLWWIVFSVDRAQAVTLHNYSKSFIGFSAMLTLEQTQKLAKNNSVISVFGSKMNRVHTTHSWDFLGIYSILQYNQLPMALSSHRHQRQS